MRVHDPAIDLDRVLAREGRTREAKLLGAPRERGQGIELGGGFPDRLQSRELPAKPPDHARPNTICAIRNAAQSPRMRAGSEVADSSQL